MFSQGMILIVCRLALNNHLEFLVKCIMNIIDIFSEHVRKYRIKMGLSQEKFAEKCGLHRTYISAIECSRRNVSLQNIQK